MLLGCQPPHILDVVLATLGAPSIYTTRLYPGPPVYIASAFHTAAYSGMTRPSSIRAALQFLKFKLGNALDSSYLGPWDQLFRSQTCTTFLSPHEVDASIGSNSLCRCHPTRSFDRTLDSPPRHRVSRRWRFGQLRPAATEHRNVSSLTALSCSPLHWH